MFFLKNLHILSIIFPIILGILSFVIRDKKNKMINIGYLFLFSLLFITMVISVFKLGLLNHKEYPVIIGGWSKAMGIELKYNLHNVFICLFLILCICLFLINILKDGISYSLRGFACIMLGGANGIALTNDIFNSYVFFEIICITSYIFYTHSENKECLKNSYNYMILSGLTGLIFLIVAGVLYQITGNLNLDIMSNIIKKIDNNKAINAVFTLFILSMFFKIGVYPLHSILISIYKNLRQNYLLMVAGISSIAYPYFILKIISCLFGTQIIANNEYLNVALKVFGGTGFIFFALLAGFTKSFLNFIIYLSFSQTSFLAFCIPYLDNKMVFNGVLFSITSQTIIKLSMFIILYQIIKQSNIDNLKKSDMQVITSKNYRILLCLLLFFVAGMPISLVFMSKWYILYGIINSYGSILWSLIVIVGLTIDIYACMEFLKQTLTKNQSGRIIKVDTNITCCLFILFSIVFIILSSSFVGYF